jgi:hypothetical protein
LPCKSKTTRQLVGIIAFATEGDTGIKKVADSVFYLPRTLDLLLLGEKARMRAGFLSFPQPS